MRLGAVIAQIQVSWAFLPDSGESGDVSGKNDWRTWDPVSVHRIADALESHQHQSYKTQKAGKTGQLRFQSYFAYSVGNPFNQKERF